MKPGQMSELRSPDDKLKNAHKLQNIGHSDLLLLVCLGPVEMHISVKYESSMIKKIGMRNRCRKTENDCHF